MPIYKGTKRLFEEIITEDASTSTNEVKVISEPGIESLSDIRR